ncbi:MAG: hypothetical protein KAS12_01415 [Candidatus Aenigmarchaeota archaeon]|nr:hypothetical protein [Candidatus Aenigmarchaeota archaeon]
MIGSLNATRVAGITFIHPKAESLRKKIMEMAADDPEMAEKYLKSLILTDRFPSLQDFANKKDDIPNRLGISVPVDKVGDKSVILKCGIEIKKDDNFHPRDTRDNIFVYTATKGTEFPIEGEASTHKYNKPKLVKKIGGNDHFPTIRSDIIKKVANEYDAKRSSGKLTIEGNPFVVYAASLIDFIYKAQSSITIPGIDTEEIKEIFNRLLCLMDPNPEVSFFLMVEPFKRTDHVIAGVILKEWISTFDHFLIDESSDSLIQEPKNVYFKYLDMATQTMGDRNVIIKNRESERMNFDEAYSKIGTPEKIKTIYDRFSKTNKYSANGVNVYNDKYFGFMSRLSYKQWTDEVRYHVGRMFRMLDVDLMYTRAELDEVLRMIEFIFPGNSYPNEIRIVPSKFKNLISPNEEFFTNVVGFIRSHAFIYIPRTVSEIREFNGIKHGGCACINPNDGIAFDTDADGLQAVDEGGKLGGSVKRMADMIKARAKQAAILGKKVLDDPDKYQKKISASMKGVTDTVEASTRAATDIVVDVKKTGDEIMKAE